jgi:hypothetical protein
MLSIRCNMQGRTTHTCRACRASRISDAIGGVDPVILLYYSAHGECTQLRSVTSAATRSSAWVNREFFLVVFVLMPVSHDLLLIDNSSRCYFLCF